MADSCAYANIPPALNYDDWARIVFDVILIAHIIWFGGMIDEMCGAETLTRRTLIIAHGEHG